MQTEEKKPEIIAFVKKVINHIENNGYMDVTALLKPPFDKPLSFMKLFDKKTQMALTDKIKEVNENAIRITEIA